eukprot:gnl/TRDRNA2_/TRDRNA2_167191_c0_seq1.p1 gnl/TRDRNA2_/TRDRNA2_167191_c0~~gnl/TRDRNA2_/TRDRNA2_167191_c0_seq1.p1  ORF type:complete len:185 (+),score=24.92 gnl/TRDRNA2_/TRDRNA2_167191_c0_seq1:114-668(+)
MRLITHNHLQYERNGFPLIIKPKEMQYEESAFNKELTVSMLPKVHYPALLQALRWVKEYQKSAGAEGLASVSLPTLPDSLTDDLKADDEFLRNLHTVLFDIHMLEGTLVCPQTGRVFPVDKGIPDMRVDHGPSAENAVELRGESVDHFVPGLLALLFLLTTAGVRKHRISQTLARGLQEPLMHI